VLLGQAQVPPHPSERPPRLPFAGQFGAQQLPFTAVVPLGQGQVPPHPSGLPLLDPSGGHSGVQQLPPCRTVPPGQPHVPLQPSSWPPRLPSLGQFGVQTQVPWTQRPLLPQPLGPQSHVSTHVPFVHVLPGAHVTPAQRLVTQLPPLQTCPFGHETAAQGSGGTQVNAQALPAPHLAAQAVNGAHLPVWASHDCPVGHVTPLQGTWKHPATQAPATQVWSFAHVTPAQGSAIGTQAAAQIAPFVQATPPSSVRHGSGWHAPARQTSPAGQVAGQPPDAVDAAAALAPPMSCVWPGVPAMPPVPLLRRVAVAPPLPVARAAGESASGGETLADGDQPQPTAAIVAQRSANAAARIVRVMRLPNDNGRPLDARNEEKGISKVVDARALCRC
jgi:hypothetical protein